MIQNSLPPLHFRMLGTCSICFKEHTLRTTDSHSKKIWILLFYMLLNRNREISQAEYIDLLWKKGKITNPTGALKTLMHRLRKFLDSLSYPDAIIIPHHGTYAFNPAVPCCIDVEEFAMLCRKAESQRGTDKYTELLRQALSLYEGDFLPESMDNTWVASLSAQYHALYLHSVRLLIELYMQKEAYAQSANLCWKALTVAPYEESIHYHLIHSLYLSGSPQAALTQYTASRNLFLTRFSQLPSKRFEELYKLITTGQNKVETDLELIQDSLKENPGTGTFFCEYEIFKEIYRLEARIVKRTQASIFLCLLTVCPAAPEAASLPESMQKLKSAIWNSLRGSDIFSRYSSSQYLLLVPAPDLITMETILKRISDHYRQDSSGDSIEYAIHPITA